jgi:hypothetical protein
MRESSPTSRRSFLGALAAAPALAVPAVAVAAAAKSEAWHGCLDLLAPLSEHELARAQRVLICMFHPDWKAALAKLDGGLRDA